MKATPSLGPIIVYVLTVVGALASAALAIDHFFLERPEEARETAFEHTRDLLQRLDDRIERVEGRLSMHSNASSDPDSWARLTTAKNYRDEADLQWREGDYEEAKVSIRAAHGWLDEITEDHGYSFAVITLILVVIGVIGAAGYYLYRQQRR